MFRYLYEWIQNIAFYLILVTVVLHAVPGENYKKYIRFFTGLVLILMLLTPVFEVFGTEIEQVDLSSLYEYVEEEEADQFKAEEDTEIGVEEIMIEW